MKEKYSKIVFLFLLIFALIPYFILCAYANPAADDFTYAFKGKFYDIIQTLISEYLNWNGRYTSNLFVLINPIAFNSFTVYKIIPVLIILSTIISFLFFIKTLLGNILSNIDRIIFSLLISLLYLYQMPIISEGIYWYTGAVTYQLGNIAALNFLSILILFCKERYIFKSKTTHTIIITFVLFLTIGFNEIIMISVLCFSGLFLFINIKYKLRHKTFAYYLFFITLAFSLFVYFAPGNTVRESNFKNIHNFIHSFIYSSLQSIRFFTLWILSIPLIITSIFYYFLNKKLSENIKLFSESFYLSRSISLILLFFVIFISVFPAYWSTGILGQHRTLNVAYFIFLILWFINLTVWFNYYKTKIILNSGERFKITLFLITFFFLIADKNGGSALSDIIENKAQFFDLQMKERYSVILADKDTIYFTPINKPPKCLFLYDITSKPDDWQNRCYNVYFENENKIILKK